jgi:hypothetical protein
LALSLNGDTCFTGAAKRAPCSRNGVLKLLWYSAWYSFG